MGTWLGWITMRGDDGAIDNIITNPKRRTRLHLFPEPGQRAALCGVIRPTEDNHLGLVGDTEAERCRRCETMDRP